MRFSLLTISSVLAAVAVAVPTPESHVVHEKWTRTPKAWTKRSRLAPDAKLPMRIGLTQSNLEKGHDLLMDV